MTPLGELAKHGHEVTFRSQGDQGRDHGTTVTSASLEGYDVIVGQRFNRTLYLDTWRRARTPLNRLVYETDDDVFHVTPVNWSAYHLYGQPGVRDAVTHMAEVADLITVTTAQLAGVMLAESGNPNIAVLPNSIPGWVLDTVREPRARPAIGWMGGASHGQDVGLIISSVRRFLARFPGWDLQLCGTDYRPTFKAGEQAKFSTWIPVFEEERRYFDTLSFDIGLVPLALTEFDRSKSNVKVLEYAARGIPAVATDCDIYRSFIRHGENGFLVKAEHEWLKYLSMLAADDGLRAKMGETARQDARAWTIERTWKGWQDAYSALFKSKSAGV
jgi:glycosyltransferase involved in cell wall biosynthesis